MKLSTKTILIAIIAFIIQQYFTFWSVALVAFLINILIRTGGFTSFLSGFLGVGLLWFLYSMYIDQNTLGIITDRIATLFQLPRVSLLLITGLLGGLVGGLAGLTGFSFYKIFERKKLTGYYH
ncbi:MAG: hypothetical protein OEX02_09255 [Cyclobacteriaceae bacterium]|nr:hypothetical protein [Cyclobacteriaceae bacterium]